MFLEMAKDMPRGREHSLSRLLVPIVVVVVAGLVAIGAWMVVDTHRLDALDAQVVEQAEQAEVLFPQGYTVPRDGERTVALVQDGVRSQGVIRVDGDEATLLVPGADGELTPAAELG